VLERVDEIRQMLRAERPTAVGLRAAGSAAAVATQPPRSPRADN
jgi:hypothetical protein